MPSFFNCFLEQLGCETSNDVCLVGRSFQAWNPKLNILALDAIKWHRQKKLENLSHVPEHISITVVSFTTVRLVCQLCFWRFSVNFLTVICFDYFFNWHTEKKKKLFWTSKILFFFFNCSKWEKFMNKSTNNCRIIDWNTTET